MNEERILKDALARKTPSPGFRDRVMANLTTVETPRSAPRRGWRAIAAGLMLTATLGGWTAWKVEQRRQEGERASQELRLALRIAGEKVQAAQQEVRTLSHD